MKLITDVYRLAKPYGRKRLLLVAAVICIQGVVQTAGVTSVVPFLVLASDPAAARRNDLFAMVIRLLPEDITDQQLLIWAGCLAILMMVASNGMALLTTYIVESYMRGLSHWMRVRLVWQIASRDYSYFLKSSTAVMLKKVNGDAKAVAQAVLSPLFTFVSGVITILLLTSTLLWIAPGVTILAGVSLGLSYTLIFAGLAKHRRVYSQSMKRISRETNLKVQQLFGGIKPIKVQGVELPFINEFSESAGQESRLLAAHSLLLIAPKYIIEPLAFGSVIAYVLYAATNGESLVSLLPTLGLMVMAAYRMLPNIQSLYNSASTFTSNGHIVEEIIDELEMVSDANSIKALQRAKPLRRIPWGDCIQMKKLCFRYPGSDRNVIDDLSLKIPKNSSIAFVGTTGCGKSTLVDLVLGLHAPSSGSLQIDNQALTRENAREWRSGVGYVPQEIFLLDDTVIANVALGVRSEDVDFGLIERVCAAAQIRQFIEMELPEKWMTKVGERGVRLSGGQRQRIGLARALYRQPDLLVLDEATSALDHVTEASVMQAIRGLNGELTMIIVAHRLSTIEWCDQVVSLQSPVSFVAE